MCCFSQPVRSVTQTSIFARSGLEGHQYIVYSMRLDCPVDVAMILPLPVKSGAGENAVRFINLEEYPEFFQDMQTAFLRAQSMGRGGFSGGLDSALEVHSVGSFEASYVPTVRDFSRLDARFRLPDRTWSQLPQYRTYGFAVFRLKPGAQTIHPMAFEFPRGDTRRLFYPTVHIHDGKVHSTASFDHMLYCQKWGEDTFRVVGWQESEKPADQYLKHEKSQSVVVPKAHLYQKQLRGRLVNQDTWLG